jgi:hypothetical protein
MHPRHLRHLGYHSSKQKSLLPNSLSITGTDHASKIYAMALNNSQLRLAQKEILLVALRMAKGKT